MKSINKTQLKNNTSELNPNKSTTRLSYADSSFRTLEPKSRECVDQFEKKLKQISCSKASLSNININNCKRQTSWKNKVFRFLSVMTRSDGRRLDIERALQLKTLYQFYHSLIFFLKNCQQAKT